MNTQIGNKPINKLAYCLLTLFLGTFGAHKFYIGRVGVGFIYLLLCWTFIPTLLSIFDFIVALLKPADALGNITF